MHKSPYKYYMSNLWAIFTTKNYSGWGRKQRGKFGLWCQKNFGGTLTLYEDGFIRSMGLGVEGSPSFSVVKDSVGIYYDATSPSALEKILNSYDFNAHDTLMEQAYVAISLIKEHHISKYNNAPKVHDELLSQLQQSHKNFLIIAQTGNDASLEYGLAAHVNTLQMIEDAYSEDPKASIYLKIHPDVISGKKQSDLNFENIPSYCTIISENVNPIELLSYMDKVFTKTSGMGMEALIVGKEVVCYGIPFYAGWGLTQDKQQCQRRRRQLQMEELFAGAYIVYSHYYNPYKQCESDILDTIQTIINLKTTTVLDI